MPINQSKVTRLTAEIRALSDDISAKERRLAAALAELGQAAGQQGRLRQGAEEDVPTPFARALGRPKGRRGRRGTLTAQVIAFLDGKKGQSFLPAQIAGGLGLPDKRKKTLSTTLFVLAKKKRIKKAAKGYGSAS